jgi:hypothetical protein
MDAFPRSFLLVFHQLAVGGFLSLSIPPFRVISRGYYQSTAVIYLLSGVAALIGRVTLLRESATTMPPSTLDWLQLITWSVFVLLAAGYVASLWSDRYVLRARLFVGTWASGVLGLVVAAVSYVPTGAFVLELIVYPLTFIVSALLLGTVLSGMLLGHWYLIDRDLPLAPFQQMLRFYWGCLLVQTALVGVGILLLASTGHADTRASLQQLTADHRMALLARCAISPLGAGVLAVMIRETLKIPQTMAATGLFYIAILAVMLGELLGRYLLFRTGIPL